MANTKITGTRPIKDPALAREVDREMEAARKRREARERKSRTQRNGDGDTAHHNGTDSA